MKRTTILCAILTLAWTAAAQSPAGSLDQRLNDAAKAGNVREMKALLQRGANPNPEEGWPLKAAAYGRSFAAVRLLLDAGADATSKTKFGYTALHDAAVWGEVDIAKLLLDHGADVNAADYEKKTPLYEASARGYAVFAEFLLSRGANVNAIAKDGTTPLLVALKMARGSAIVDVLLRHGADVNVADETSNTAIMLAAASSNPQLVATLLKRGANASEYRSKRTPLHAVAEGASQWKNERSIETARVLLAAGARIDTHSQPTWTSPTGPTPLFVAACGLRPQLTEFFLDEGAAVDARSIGGETALMCVARQRSFANPDVFMLLLNRGADPNARDEEGRSPLMHAAEAGSELRVKQLLARGSDPRLVDKKGRTAFDLAALNGWKNVTALLPSPASTPVQRAAALFSAADNGNLDEARLQIDNGADVNALDDHGATPLIHAARSGHVAVIALLLDRGADPRLSAKDPARWSGAPPVDTALLEAARFGFGEAVALLAQRQSPTKEEATRALIYGAREVVAIKALLAAGADPNGADERGLTPLAMAAQMGCRDCVVALLDAGADPGARHDGSHAVLASAPGSEIERILFDRTGANPSAMEADAARAAVFRHFLTERPLDPKTVVVLEVETHEPASPAILRQLEGYRFGAPRGNAPRFGIWIESLRWIGRDEVYVLAAVHRCQAGCGYGVAVFLRKEASAWVVKSVEGTWVE